MRRRLHKRYLKPWRKRRTPRFRATSLGPWGLLQTASERTRRRGFANLVPRD